LSLGLQHTQKNKNQAAKNIPPQISHDILQPKAKEIEKKFVKSLLSIFFNI
jgi:hypothetical protein